MSLTSPIRSQAAQLRSFGQPARLFLFATLVDGIVYSGWNLFFNFYILERGFARNYLGMVNAAPSLAILLLGIPMGVLSDRLGRKRAMVLGVGLSIVFMTLEVTVTNPILILVFAFLNGTAASLYFLSQAPFMMKASTEQNRTLLFSLNFGLITLSGAFGSAFAGQLPGLFSGLLGVAPRSSAAYQAVLLASIFLSLFTLVPLLLIREPSPTHTHDLPRQKQPLLQILRKPFTLKIALPNLLIGLGAAILIPYMNLFFVESFAVSSQALGVYFSLSSLMTGIGTLIGPRLALRLGGKIRAVVFTQAASLFFLLLMGFTPVLWPAVIGFLFRATLMNMAFPLYNAFAMEQVAEAEQGTVNSIKELAWQFGWTVGPYTSGLVQQVYGFTPLFVATAGLYATASLLTWIFFRQHEALLLNDKKEIGILPVAVTEETAN